MDRKSKNEAENGSVSAHQPQTAEVCGNSTALAAPATWYSLDAKLFQAKTIVFAPETAVSGSEMIISNLQMTRNGCFVNWN